MRSECPRCQPSPRGASKATIEGALGTGQGHSGPARTVRDRSRAPRARPRSTPRRCRTSERHGPQHRRVQRLQAQRLQAQRLQAQRLQAQRLQARPLRRWPPLRTRRDHRRSRRQPIHTGRARIRPELLRKTALRCSLRRRLPRATRTKAAATEPAPATQNDTGPSRPPERGGRPARRARAPRNSNVSNCETTSTGAGHCTRWDLPGPLEGS
jgi:hypothetical protein